MRNIRFGKQQDYYLVTNEQRLYLALLFNLISMKVVLINPEKKEISIIDAPEVIKGDFIRDSVDCEIFDMFYYEIDQMCQCVDIYCDDKGRDIKPQWIMPGFSWGVPGKSIVCLSDEDENVSMSEEFAIQIKNYFDKNITWLNENGCKY